MDKGAGFDYYLNWTKTLVAETNAAIGCLHANAEGLKVAECEQAERILVSLRKMRDGFEQTVGIQKVAGVGEKAEQHLHAILQEQAVAQRKAWREFAEQLNAMAEVLAAKHNAEFGDLLKHLNADAEAAEGKLKQLSGAGSQSLSALSSALRNIRIAPGKAAQTAQQAFCKALLLSPAE